MRASTARQIAATASTSLRDGRARQRCMARIAQTNAGYATTSVSKNDASVSQTTVACRRRDEERQARRPRHASARRYAGIAADVITNAFSTWAWWNPCRTSPCRNTNERSSG